MKKIIAAITILLAFPSCKEDVDFGEYYEGFFKDSITIVSQSDTINIVIEQPRLKKSILYSEETNNINSDSINLKLFVSFGSYDQTPKVFKETNKVLDTFYVWYSALPKSNKTLNKNSYITKASTSPRLSYVSIDSIVIQKPNNKVVNLY